MIIEKHRNDIDSAEDDQNESDYYSMTEFDETSENSELIEMQRKDGDKIQVKDLKKT